MADYPILLAQYTENEAVNDHTANGVLLAEHFGTEDEKRKVQILSDARDRHGDVKSHEEKWRYENIHPYYWKLKGLAARGIIDTTK